MEILKLLTAPMAPRPFWGAVIGAAASLIGQQKSSSDSIGHSKYQLDYQRDLANSAHEREMTDLRRAGLNPILSAKLGGAGNVSPTGVQIPDYGKSAQAGIQAAQREATVKQAEATASNIRQDEKLKIQQTRTEKIRTNAEAMRAADLHASATEHQRRAHLLEVQEISERYRLPEREAEALYWSTVSSAGKALGSAKDITRVMKDLKTPKVFKNFKGTKTR